MDTVIYTFLKMRKLKSKKKKKNPNCEPTIDVTCQVSKRSWDAKIQAWKIWFSNSPCCMLLYEECQISYEIEGD